MSAEAHQYAAAEKLLSMALNQDPEISLKYMAGSKVLRDILGNAPSFNPLNSLQENYTTALNALKLIKAKAKFGPEDLNWQVKIF